MIPRPSSRDPIVFFHIERRSIVFGAGLWVLGLVALLSGGCRERLVETPGLQKARALQAEGPAAAPASAVDHAPEGFEAHLVGGTEALTDHFDRASLGPRWTSKSAQWRIKDGAVVNQHADNAGLWLLDELPKGDLRIEFDVRSDPFQTRDKRSGKLRDEFPGDLKCEAFNQEPRHQTGYIFIFGGWNNRKNRIARLEEHGEGEGARVVDGPALAVKPGHTYRMKVLRLGDTVAYYADDTYLVHMQDAKPIRGRYFGFNNWRSHLTFDNLAVFSLNDEARAKTPPNKARSNKAQAPKTVGGTARPPHGR